MGKSKYTYESDLLKDGRGRLSDGLGTIAWVDSSSAMAVITQLEKRDERIVELEKQIDEAKRTD